MIGCDRRPHRRTVHPLALPVRRSAQHRVLVALRAPLGLGPSLRPRAAQPCQGGLLSQLTRGGHRRDAHHVRGQLSSNSRLRPRLHNAAEVGLADPSGAHVQRSTAAQAAPRPSQETPGRLWEHSNRRALGRGVFDGLAVFLPPFGFCSRPRCSVGLLGPF